MELLAPVGSFGTFATALQEGADAIYIGAPDLNARALSRDFSCGSLLQVQTDTTNYSGSCLSFSCHRGCSYDGHNVSY